MEKDAELSCGHWMPLLAPHLPAPLVEPAALLRLGALMGQLPATVSGALEIRLGEGSGPVDLSVRVCDTREAGRIARGISLGDSEAFLLRWARQRDPNVPFVWLEFDLPQNSARPNAPLVISRIGGQAPDGWLMDTLLPSLREVPPTSAQLATIRRALRDLPGGARCCYVFDLSPRGAEAIRLSFADLTPDDMPGFLEKVGRPDLAQPVAEALPFMAESDRRELNFDVDGEGNIAPRVGLEISFAAWPGSDPRWPRLFDRLVAAKLCEDTKRLAAFAWPGHDSRQTAPGVWPAAAAYAKSHLLRWISHVKLVCVPGRAMEAKVYLVFGLWTRGRDGRLKEGPAGLEATA